MRHYGANIFVVDLVGVSMLREFAPLIAAIIVAGRSGSLRLPVRPAEVTAC